LRHGFAVAVIGTLLAFQNCAQAPETSLTGSNSASSYTQNLPLAVKGQIDTIAYMSCSEIKDSVDKRAYFTFRAGAYSDQTGGLQLTQEFINATQHYTDTERAKSFADSEPNGDTLYSLSIRSAANYQAPWVSETINVGEELDAFLPPLDAPEISGALAATAHAPRDSADARINYFPGVSTQRLMEASLRFYKFDNVMKDTRNALEGGGNSPGGSLLVAGFSGSSDPMNTTLRAPPNSAAAPGGAAPVYGKGFRILFAVPPGVNNGEKRVISSDPSAITEMDLMYSPPLATNAQWDCPSVYKFVIVRPEDKAAAKVVCNATVDRFANATEQAMLGALRRVLRVEDWFIDITNRCVMPKRTGDYCYGALGGRTIQYGLNSCTNGTGTMCPHYVSVCIRR
jgi:hypothetical protein